MKNLRMVASFVFLAPLFSYAQTDVPAQWSCDATLYGDGICDCGCDVRDEDCGGGTFTVCERSGCPEGQVPWEHQPHSCMRSACGDGWVDERAGEVCDDGDALLSGGCYADCSAVNVGWECGVGAAGCTRVQNSPEPDAGSSLMDLGNDDLYSDSSLAMDLGSTESSDASAGTPPLNSEETADNAGGCNSSNAPNGPLVFIAFCTLFLMRWRRGEA